MWLYFALLTPLFWSVVHVMDSHCVEEILEKPWVGVVTGAFSSLLVLIPLTLLVFITGRSFPSSSVVLLAISAGALIQISQAFYFKALSFSEAGIVAAYWNITPALLPIASYLILGKIFFIPEYFGIFILILCSVFFCLIDSYFHTRWRAFWLMFAASILQSAALMLEDFVYDQTNYIMGFYLVTSGLIIAGLLPLLFKRARQRIKSNAVKLRKAAFIFIFIEIFNLSALASSQKAVSLGSASLVAAVETTVPAYTFLLSLLLFSFGSRMGDALSEKKIYTKIALVAMMIFGVWLVS